MSHRWFLLPMLIGPVLTGACGSDIPTHSVSFDSKSYTIDRIYRSMKGPMGVQSIQLHESEQPELLWITGYRAEIADPKTGGPRSEEFMCHSNLNFDDFALHQKLFGWKNRGRKRLFTLSQGQMDVRFPKGFGVPVLSNEPLSLATQVLNLNEQEQKLRVRHKTTIEFVRDAELQAPMKPLFQHAAQGMVLIDGRDGYYDISRGNPEEHGEGCSVGNNAGGVLQRDRFGREFAGHWQVPPGRQVNHTLVTGFMALPFDTTVHYIAVHLHPFAESLTLRDLTVGKDVFRSETRSPTQRIGLEHVEHFSSRKGIPIYKRHQYELVSEYDNSSGVMQDSMAVMFLYVLDKAFKKPMLD